MATPPGGFLPHQPPLIPSSAAANTSGINILSGESFTFHNGDVRILIKLNNGIETTGLVSSHAMSLASPVWQKFIFPPFGPTVQPVEGVSQGGTAGETRNLRQQPVEQIDFREDDPEALRILLRIAHLKFRDIPSQLSYKTLLNIAILCDQYDCVDLVVSFLPQWLSNEEVESKKPGQVNWLFIAWVFGRRKVFEELSKHLIRNLSIGEDDEYYISGARVDEPLPAEILESIMEVRGRTVTSLLGICYSKTNFYKNRDYTRCFYVQESCDAMTYGSLVLGLEDIGLWPQQPVSEISCCIDYLAKKISGLRVYTWYNKDDPLEFHEGCGATSFRGDVSDILGEISNPVLQVHYEHMEAVNKL